MDYSIFVFIIKLIFIPILIGLISALFYYIYLSITSSCRIDLSSIKTFSFIKKNKNLFLENGIKNCFNYVLCLYFIVAIILTFLIGDVLYYNALGLNFDLIIILFCILIPLIFSGINYKSQDLLNPSKEFFSTIIEYYVPILLSILSILIILGHYSIDLSGLTISNITDFQNNSKINLGITEIPAFFLIINPFAAVAFFTGIMGGFRTYKKEFYINNKINQKLFSKILRNVSFFAMNSLFVLLFMGGGHFFSNNHRLWNVVSCILTTFILILIISLIDYGRPKLFIERKIWNFINIPLLFSILSVIYSISFSFLFSL